MRGSHVLLALATLGLFAGVSSAAVIADWTFQGTGAVANGTVFTDSTGNYTATVVGTGAILTADGIQFPTSSTAYLTTNLPISSFSTGATTTATVQELFLPDNTTHAATPAYVERLIGSGGDGSWQVYQHGSGVGTGNIGDSGPGGYGSSGILTNALTNIAMVQRNISGWNMAFYVNGVTSNAAGGNLSSSPTAGNLMIGAYNGGSTGDQTWLRTILRTTVTSTAADQPGYDVLGSTGGAWIDGPGAVPEPTSLGLVGLGMMGLVARRKRRQ